MWDIGHNNRKWPQNAIKLVEGEIYILQNSAIHSKNIYDTSCAVVLGACSCSISKYVYTNIRMSNSSLCEYRIYNLQNKTFPSFYRRLFIAANNSFVFLCESLLINC